MRIWTLHPKYLDSKGLVSAWREALLAQKVLKGSTQGYTNHPQLKRFKKQPKPLSLIRMYLCGLNEEAISRGFNFDKKKICSFKTAKQITTTHGQLLFEWKHLKKKLKKRDIKKYRELLRIKHPKPHIIFKVVKGDVEEWEIRRKRA